MLIRNTLSSFFQKFQASNAAKSTQHSIGIPPENMLHMTGTVEIEKGQILLRSPLTQRECVHWTLHVHAFTHPGKWQNIIHDCRTVPFTLQTTLGNARVSVQNPTVAIPRNSVLLRNMSELKGILPQYTWTSDMCFMLLVLEGVIEPGHSISLRSKGQRSFAGIEICESQNNPVFIRSAAESPQQIRSLMHEIADCSKALQAT